MKQLNYFFLLIFLGACSVSKEWKSNDTPGHIYGSFGYLNGTQQIGLKVPLDKPILKYTLENNSSDFRLLIKSGKHIIIDTLINQRISGTILLKSDDGNDYNVKLIGKGGGGSYDIECLANE